MSSEDRKFIKTVGGAFTVLTVILIWRNRVVPAVIAGSAAVILALLAVLAPAAVSTVRAGWMKGAHAISRVTTPVILAVVYFGVLTPIGLARRAMGRSSLKSAGVAGGWWVAREHRARPPADMRRQF